MVIGSKVTVGLLLVRTILNSLKKCNLALGSVIFAFTNCVEVEWQLLNGAEKQPFH